jgi:hypothetical protein
VEQRIGDIFNVKGVLLVKRVDNSFYWGIQEWKGCDWSEIPEYLYMTLVHYENERKLNNEN